MIMMIRGMKWINAKMELTKIGIELNNLYLKGSKYEWKPEFLWTKAEVEEVVELLERAYELVSKGFGLYMLVGLRDKMAECNESLENLNAEIWVLRQRLAA
jgi:uncharacterized protein (DUF2164 family)